MTTATAVVEEKLERLKCSNGTMIDKVTRQPRVWTSGKSHSFRLSH